ncbi:ribonuclease H-like domain-containing protein [Trametes elegans]|nr:ribonuclease H-like domain-containing protein [Trametes elegans]
MSRSRTKPSFYAVAKGRMPGIYTQWDDCKAQTLNYHGAKYKKFMALYEAKAWIADNAGPDVAHEVMTSFLALNPAFAPPTLGRATAEHLPNVSAPSIAAQTASLPSVPSTVPDLVAQPFASGIAHPLNDEDPWVVYSDGSCRGNGRAGAVGGVGVWWGRDHPWNICERCPGIQTNNRAELIAIIRVLETAPTDQHQLVIKTDSQYSISCLREWLPGWKRAGWRTSNGKPVSNLLLIKYADLLIHERRELAQQHVELVKVLGHSGDEGNDGADRLANLGATKPETPERDWEDLMRQADARMGMLSSGADRTTAAPAPAKPLALGSTSILLITVPHTLAQPQHPAASLPIAHAPVYSSSSNVPVDGSSAAAAATASRVTHQPESITERSSQEDMLTSGASSNPVWEISSNEWELYAACALSDDEFLDEAERLGVLA